jgi:acetyltransferase-like isoleucine patch superfamily enzyme
VSSPCACSCAGDHACKIAVRFRKGLILTFFYSADELAGLGLRRYGDDVLIDRAARIIRPDRLELGSHVRIDAFSIISCGDGGVSVGDYVHIAAFAFLAGAGRIEIGDFVNLSGRVSIYTSNDDYSGATLAGPMVPERYRGTTTGPVTVGRHAIVGAGTVILPNVMIGEGAAVGALSLIRHDVAPFTVWAGGRTLKERQRDLLELEQAMLRDEGTA